MAKPQTNKLALIKENIELRLALRDLVEDYDFHVAYPDRPPARSGVNHAKRILGIKIKESKS